MLKKQEVIYGEIEKMKKAYLCFGVMIDKLVKKGSKETPIKDQKMQA